MRDMGAHEIELPGSLARFGDIADDKRTLADKDRRNRSRTKIGVRIRMTMELRIMWLAIRASAA